MLLSKNFIFLPFSLQLFLDLTAEIIQLSNLILVIMLQNAAIIESNQ